MLRNTFTSYGLVSIGLHWLMAIAIFAMFGLGVWMKSLGYYDAWYNKGPDLHQGIGMLVLALLLFRIGWVFINVKPDALGAAWERTGGIIAHWFFYVLMLVIMVSGYLIPTAKGEGFDIFGDLHIPALLSLTARQADMNGAIHRYVAWSIMIVAALHVLASLKHHFVNKDTTLLRILGMSPKR